MLQKQDLSKNYFYSMTDLDRKYKLAQQKVKAKKGFFIHLSSYVIMGFFFLFINLFTDPSEIWFPIPLAAWGIGIAFHYIGVFGIPGRSADWEKQQMEKELQKLGIYEEDDLDLDDHLDLDALKAEKVKDWKDDDLV